MTTSVVPKMGECYGGENDATYEDGLKIKNVGEPQVIENEPSLTKDDNAPQLDQDVPPPSQSDCPNERQLRKNKARLPCFGGCNSDLAKAERGTTAFLRPKKGKRTLSRRDTTPHNYEMVPQIADSARPLPLVNEDNDGGWNSNLEQAGGHSRTLSWSDEESLDYIVCMPLPPPPIIDSTLLNHGRAPLIGDFYVDSARPLPSVNEDVYGGGIRTRFDQRGCEAIVQVTNAGQGYGVSAPQVSLSAHLTEQKSTHQVNPNGTVLLPEQNSSHRVNPTVEIAEKFGGCFPWFR